jgi:hypothetical protein
MKRSALVTGQQPPAFEWRSNKEGESHRIEIENIIGFRWVIVFLFVFLS